MKLYRLKSEAVPFFKEDISTWIASWTAWNDRQVDINALEEVEDVHLTFGHKDKDNTSSSLSGWNDDDGSHFHFTVHFPSTKLKEHDFFSNGKVVRELMNKIQYHINNFQGELLDKTTDA